MPRAFAFHYSQQLCVFKCIARFSPDDHHYISREGEPVRTAGAIFLRYRQLSAQKFSRRRRRLAALRLPARSRLPKVRVGFFDFHVSKLRNRTYEHLLRNL